MVSKLLKESSPPGILSFVNTEIIVFPFVWGMAIGWGLFFFPEVLHRLGLWSHLAEDGSKGGDAVQTFSRCDHS